MAPLEKYMAAKDDSNIYEYQDEKTRISRYAPLHGDGVARDAVVRQVGRSSTCALGLCAWHVEIEPIREGGRQRDGAHVSAGRRLSSTAISVFDARWFAV